MSARSFLVASAAVLLLAACGADGDPAANTGDGLYAANCASCHGAELEGNVSGPPLRSVIYGPDEYSDDEMKSAISNGVSEPRWGIGVMVAFPRLSDEQLDLLVAHIRDEQERLGLIDVRP